MKISAGTAEKQRELTQRQIDLTLRQASAELVFQNYKVQSTSGNEEKTVVSFDLANIGGSAATEIREDGTTGVYHRIEEAVGATVVKANLTEAISARGISGLHGRNYRTGFKETALAYERYDCLHPSH